MKVNMDLIPTVHIQSHATFDMDDSKRSIYLKTCRY